ncbi:hypothetical protein Solca_2389 [Solitalea canadensis DSM 3403]|uniref:Uncharacterized protein n=1 Tax=Solitalea canadensis (strain ATCC 29591 / DSM 3403 / JCM 21819 / LMG 8368 / NBRC 15130 / NCIMB 12057 / USAM 9D) TaxID=929556 RepID=H8KUK6_SOLCM|nr:hypothetical protein Solca_2389 [Solitalea canadensis DSM 3403]
MNLRHLINPDVINTKYSFVGLPLIQSQIKKQQGELQKVRNQLQHSVVVGVRTDVLRGVKRSVSSEYK